MNEFDLPVRLVIDHVMIVELVFGLHLKIVQVINVELVFSLRLKLNVDVSVVFDLRNFVFDSHTGSC